MPFSLSSNRREFLTAAGATVLLPRVAWAQSRRLVIAMPNGTQFATLEPSREYSNVAFRIGYNIFDTLIGVDFRNQFKLVPGLATEWRRVSPTALEFKLREGVRFHDGEVMSAEDVAFSFGPERMSDPKAPGYALTRPFLQTLASVEATGPMTVMVTTKSIDPLIEKRLAGWGGQIISKKSFLAAANFTAWEKAPVGTGPFKVKSFKQDEQIVLVAHENYFGGRSPVDELVFTVASELATRMNMLQSGEADILTELAPDQIKVVAAMADREVVGGPVLNIRGIVYDKNHPVLADARVRRALSLSIDRQAIVDSLYEGRTRVPQGPQNESYGEMFIKDYKGVGFEPDAARSLLKAAGYAGDQIAYRVLNNYYTLQVQTAQVLVEMWRSVGLNVRIEMKENWSQVLDPAGRGIYDTSDTIFWQDPVGAMVRRYGPASAVQAQYKAWSNAAFNALCPVLQDSLDLETRRDAFRKMMTIFDETDPPGTYLHDLTLFYGKKRGLSWASYPVEYMDFRAQNMA